MNSLEGSDLTIVESLLVSSYNFGHGQTTYFLGVSRAASQAHQLEGTETDGNVEKLADDLWLGVKGQSNLTEPVLPESYLGSASK